MNETSGPKHQVGQALDRACPIYPIPNVALWLILALASAGCRGLSPNGTEPTAARPGEAQALFNKTNLAGWKVHCVPMDRSKAYWRAEAGCIVADSTAGADHDYIWLTTEREYGDFELRLKFQAFRDSTGNSGVQIRSRYDEAAGWLDGPQLDIHPPAPWRTGMIYDETRGVQKWISPSVPKVTDVRPDMAAVNLVMHFADELTAWNDFQITARGTRVRAVLNGVVVQDWDGAGVLDDATHRQRNVGLRGHIALQIHRGDRLKMRFKDITLRELSGNDYAVVTAGTKSALVSALGWWAVQKNKGRRTASAFTHGAPENGVPNPRKE